MLIGLEQWLFEGHRREGLLASHSQTTFHDLEVFIVDTEKRLDSFSRLLDLWVSPHMLAWVSPPMLVWVRMVPASFSKIGKHRLWHLLWGLFLQTMERGWLSVSRVLK